MANSVPFTSPIQSTTSTVVNISSAGGEDPPNPYRKKEAENTMDEEDLDMFSDIKFVKGKDEFGYRCTIQEVSFLAFYILGSIFIFYLFYQQGEEQEHAIDEDDERDLVIDDSGRRSTESVNKPMDIHSLIDLNQSN